MAAGGFNENMVAAEDWDLTKRLKKIGKFGKIKSVIYHNESLFSLLGYLKKKSYYAADVHNYLARWSRNDPDIKKQFGFYYRFIGVFIESGKWKKLLKHPLLGIGMYFLKGLAGCIYLVTKK